MITRGFELLFGFFVALLVSMPQGVHSMSEKAQKSSEGMEYGKMMSATEAEAQMKSHKPCDCRGFIYWEKNKLAIVYQRRIEFYTIPHGIYPLMDGTSLEGGCGSRGSLLFVRGDKPKPMGLIKIGRKHRLTKLVPDKVIRSRYFIEGIGIADIIRTIEDSCGAFIVYSRMDDPEFYIASSEQEVNKFERWYFALGKKFHYKWPGDKNAELGEIYGMFKVSGELVFELPLPAVAAGKFLRPLIMKSDGSAAYFGIVRKVEAAGRGYWKLGDISGVIKWTPEGGIRRMTLTEANADPFIKKYDATAFYRFKEEDLLESE